MTYLITYIPINPFDRNEELIKQIKSFSTWALLNSINYIVCDNDTKTVELRDKFVKYLRPKEKILVSELTGNGAWKGFSLEMSEWLKKHL